MLHSLIIFGINYENKYELNKSSFQPVILNLMTRVDELYTRNHDQKTYKGSHKIMGRVLGQAKFANAVATRSIGWIPFSTVNAKESYHTIDVVMIPKVRSSQATKMASDWLNSATQKRQDCK